VATATYSVEVFIRAGESAGVASDALASRARGVSPASLAVKMALAWRQSGVVSRFRVFR
jgi:hypothetical protein